uniref:ULP_PROTEASE domain-containing protein n=1 Tax=Caenorhabditis tropicalis TaxID=1561998 RepID=A0A1I7UE44_9PELO
MSKRPSSPEHILQAKRTRIECPEEPTPSESEKPDLLAQKSPISKEGEVAKVLSDAKENAKPLEPVAKEVAQPKIAVQEPKEVAKPPIVHPDAAKQPAKPHIFATCPAIQDSHGKQLISQVNLKEADILSIKAPKLLTENTLMFCLNLVLSSNPKVAERVSVLSPEVFRCLSKRDVFGKGILEDIHENCQEATKLIPQKIFEKDIVIMPMKYEGHWMLTIILQPFNAVIEDGESCMIILGDLDEQRMKTIIETFLSYHLEDQKSLLQYSPTTVFHCERLKMARIANLPKRENDYDCGPFVVLFLQGILSQEHGILSEGSLDWTDLSGGMTTKNVRNQVWKMISSVGTPDSNSCIKELLVTGRVAI